MIPRLKPIIGAWVRSLEPSLERIFVDATFINSTTSRVTLYGGTPDSESLFEFVETILKIDIAFHAVLSFSRLISRITSRVARAGRCSVCCLRDGVWRNTE